MTAALGGVEFTTYFLQDYSEIGKKMMYFFYYILETYGYLFLLRNFFFNYVSINGIEVIYEFTTSA